MSDGDHPINVENTDKAEIVEGGDLGNMFLVDIGGEIKHVKNSPANKLLYKHGLYEFLYTDNNKKKILSEDPFAAVKPIDREGEYKVWYENKDIGVISRPSDERKVLNGVLESIENNDYSGIRKVYEEIFSRQVRRQVVSPLSIMYPRGEVVPAEDGWIIRGMFKLTWEAEIYLVGKDLEEGDYRRRGGSVVKTDSPQEILTLSGDYEQIEPRTIEIGNSEYTLTELEREFISKVEFLLEFEENIEDPEFANIIRRYISGDVQYADNSPDLI